MSFFSGLKKEFNLAANTVSREANHLASSASHAYNETITSPELEKFRSGNVIQLVSRSSGKAVQVVVSPSGQLVVDGNGPEGPQVYHGHWTVVDEGNNIVKLHNNNNFLAIVDGTTQILNFGQNPMAAGQECKFRLSQNANFILLENFKEKNRHVGVLPSGELKSAMATGRENDAQFGVRLIYRRPPPQPPAPVSVAPGVYIPPGSTVTVIQHSSAQPIRKK